MNESFWYLATPYSKFPGGLDKAFEMAALNASVLVKAGVPVFSPIAHTHPIAVQGGIDPYSHDIWMPVDRPFMTQSKGLIVVMEETWEKSYGISIEIDQFKKDGKPVVYMTPGELPQLP